jgi:hypothetical protein
MKKVIECAVIALAVGALLSSCASVPKPEGESDTLVVGSFVSDFPDGFFGDPSRTLESNLRLDFTNLATGQDFSIVTSKRGYFYFLSNGSDDYELTGYSFRENVERKTFSGGNTLSLKFAAFPRCVHYLGHWVLTNSSPGMKTATGTGTQTWNYEYSIDRQFKDDEMHDYLQKAAADSVWLSYEMKHDSAR